MDSTVISICNIDSGRIKMVAVGPDRCCTFVLDISNIYCIILKLGVTAECVTMTEHKRAHMDKSSCQGRYIPAEKLQCYFGSLLTTKFM